MLGEVAVQPEDLHQVRLLRREVGDDDLVWAFFEPEIYRKEYDIVFKWFYAMRNFISFLVY